MKHAFIVGLLLSIFPCIESRSDSLDHLIEGFVNVQDSTRTKLWWFHGETETTREGITADLTAFRNQGIGGVVYYDQVFGNGEHALKGLSPEWFQMLTYASKEADRLGLTFETNVSNGYVAGGKWITPELGMQRLVDTETIVNGGGDVSVQLAEPQTSYNYYGDIAVLAVPYNDSMMMDSRIRVPKVFGDIPSPALVLGEKMINLPARPKGESTFIVFDFGGPFTARNISYKINVRGISTTSSTNVPGKPSKTFVGTSYRILPNIGELEVSDDNIHYRKVCSLVPVYGDHMGWNGRTVAFPATTGRYFRLNLHDWYETGEQDKSLRIGNVSLSARAKINVWEEKAGLYSEYVEEDLTPSYLSQEVINKDEIIILTDKVDSTGRLVWKNVPKGRWLVMRFAHVPTGARSKHGRKELLGLECDKLSEKAAVFQWNNYVQRIIDTLAVHGGRLDGVVMDSHEQGAQNWTEGFEKYFHQRNGYDITNYLPVMMGYIVDSKNVSTGFLYDLRRTIADMMTEKYYGTFERLCKERGLVFTAQATGNALCFVGDNIEAKKYVDKPQGEFWALHPDGNYDIKDCSSAAHIYGKPIASAEAFTGSNYSHPLSYFKQLADYAYCYGINEFVVCASAAQPWLDKIPGNTVAGKRIDFSLNRNNPFWDYSRDFWDYTARNAYIMRQGKPVADYCLYLGDNAPVKILTYRLPYFPKGYDFDAFTGDALMERMQCENQRIVLPDGNSYAMMLLPRNGDITLKALRKIAGMVKDGIRVYGNRPTGSRSLIDIKEKQSYEQLVDSLWGSEECGVKQYGKGKVYWGMSLEEATRRENILPDVQFPKSEKIFFAHRQTEDADIFYIDNHQDKDVQMPLVFRSKHRYVQLWNSVTGKRYRLEAMSTTDERQSVNIKMRQRESFIFVLSDQDENLINFPNDECEDSVTIDGSWVVDFDTRMGGRQGVILDSLIDWTKSDDPQIKYFSGTAVYMHDLKLKTQRSKRYVLEFNKLCSAGKVFVNGVYAGNVWCSPWSIDITPYLKKGRNTLEIHVVNSIMNRVIRDASLPESKRVTFCTVPLADAHDKLSPAGIIGQVRILISKK